MSESVSLQEKEKENTLQRKAGSPTSGMQGAAPPPFSLSATPTQMKTGDPIQKQDGPAGARQPAAPAAALDVSSLPEGKIRDAATALAASDREVERNTAQRLVDGDIQAFYIEDLTQPDDVEAMVRRQGRDPAEFTIYNYPVGNGTMWVQLNAEGFRVNGHPWIFGWRRLSLARWKSLLVHETNHARNVDPVGILADYQSEFRAYWVAEYAGVADLEERARQVKAHILRDYPLIRREYDSNDETKAAIDAHTRPDGNITNA